MKPVHLEGMGVIGSLCAWHLERAGRPFTWSDTDTPTNAWSACTGAVYPSGDRQDERDRLAWMEWHAAPPWGEPGVTETGAYWYTSKGPPHKGRHAVVARSGRWSLSSAPSVHVHAPRLVALTRAAFGDRRTAGPEPGQVSVVAHGFGPRLHRVVWGWHAKVRLVLPDGMHHSHAADRPCLYVRPDRFRFAYAYPVPGDPECWWAGSSLIVQKAPRLLEVAPKYSTWARLMMLYGGVGSAPAAPAGHAFRQGWRPQPAPDDAPEWRWIDGRLAVKPHWHDGVRAGPRIVSALAAALAAAA